MIRIVKWLNNPVLIAILVTAGVITDLVLLGQHYDLSKSDWATWVGSIGTVATLAGTIWLATAAERQRKREQVDLAIISAASMTTWISNLRSSIWVANQTLPGSLAAPDDAREALIDCINEIDRAGLWTREDLAPLVYLPHHAAARLASLAVQIDSAMAALRRGSEKSQLGVGDIIGIGNVLSSEFTFYAKELGTIQAECLTFLRAHGFNTERTQ